MKPLYRNYDLATRATPDDDGMNLTGIGVPYNREIQLFPGYFERFAPGSIYEDNAILRFAHSEPIGTITECADTDDGRQIRARISDTTRGREVATLIRDGALSKFSIGFYLESFTTDERDDGTHITITKARAIEYSVVEFPAYQDATITSLRHSTEKDTSDMTGSTINPAAAADLATRAEIDALATAIDDILREVRSTPAPTPTDGIAFNFRSMGEYAHALVRRDEAAESAFNGAVVGDTIARPSWLGVIEKRMTAKQPITNMFTHSFDLPNTGMVVEYGKRKDPSTVAVGKQAKEGDALVKGKPGTYEVKTAPIHTYGGYGVLSLQAIERASVSLLDDLLYDQAMQYAAEIEKATRALFESTVATAENAPLHTMTNLASTSVNEWTDIILALIDAYEDTPYVMDGLAVSSEVFAALAHLDRSPKALQFTAAPLDHQGTITLADATASYGPITVKRVPKWTGKHAVGYCREAIRVKEAPGAPFRLQDSEILDLTKEFAVYGYAAHFAPSPDLVKAIKISA